MTKKFKVVMLPSGKPVKVDDLVQYKHIDSSIRLGVCSRVTPASHLLSPQTLYILSNDEIKEGDWFLSAFGSYPLHNVPCGYHEYPSDLSVHQKIVATTDELKFYSEGANRIPQLSESFIQAFIKAYNDGKPITEIEMGATPGVCVSEHDFIIKTSPDNTVIANKVYSRDEIEILIKIALEDSCKYTNLKDFTDTHL